MYQLVLHVRLTLEITKQIDKSTNIQALIVQEHHRVIQISYLHINVQHGSWI